MSFYGWIWVGLIIDFAIYGYVGYSLRQHALSKESLTRSLMKLLAYPFIIIFSWFVVCIYDNTAVAYNAQYHGQHALNYLGNFLACSQGCFTSIYFFYVNEEVVRSFRQFLRGESFRNIEREAIQRVSYANRATNSNDNASSSVRSASDKNMSALSNGGSILYTSGVVQDDESEENRSLDGKVLIKGSASSVELLASNSSSSSAIIHPTTDETTTSTASAFGDKSTTVE